MKKTTIIAEIGINFAFGNDRTQFLANAKKLIDVAVVANCDYVKFQKRDPDICVPEDQKNKVKVVPWRSEPTTYLQYKKDIEFGLTEYTEIDNYCRARGIKWFASVWDKPSVDFMAQFTRFMKIPSAKITDIELCEYVRKDLGRSICMSTGMSTEEEIMAGWKACMAHIVMHTNSTYPSPVEELNLNYIKRLRTLFSSPMIDIGYSGHEFGLTTTFGAVMLGATWVERHITLNRTFWGSDQMASVEPTGLIKLVKGIKDLELAVGEDVQDTRKLFPSELAKRKSLRGV